MHPTYLIILVVAFVGTVLCNLFWTKRVRSLGLLPPKGTVTNPQLKELIEQGHEIVALKALREREKLGLRQAKKELEKIIQQ